MDEDINGEVTGYIVSVTVDDTAESFTVNTTATNVSVTQLHPFYTHRCSVTCVTVAEGPYSEPISVKTLQDGMITNTCAVTMHSIQWIYLL